MAGTGIEHVAQCAATLCDQLEELYGEGFQVYNTACVVEVAVEGEDRTRVLHLAPAGGDRGAAMLAKAAELASDDDIRQTEIQGRYTPDSPEGLGD